MTSTARRFTGLAATQIGRTQQLTRAYKGLAADLKRRAAERVTVPDELDNLSAAQLRRLVESLRNQLADAQTLIDDMRASANGSSTDLSAPPVQFWDSARVARESNVAVCTICRNAQSLGGQKLGGDWMFPVGTTYGKRRKPKAH